MRESRREFLDAGAIMVKLTAHLRQLFVWGGLWAATAESAWGAGGPGQGRCDGSCGERWTLHRLSWGTQECRCGEHSPRGWP
ncbi:hypothetical protein [Kamptonema formosum]|uniref:hypothetical protein n=1 Tax=Kamptonema formosum TaxID=331992 RepID=UPI0012DD2C18|nr:hypothetical protein [Oscillatoria sp. PCC 10802]